MRTKGISRKKLQNLRPEAPESENGMKYIEISDAIFKDLIGCKSKIEDIKALLDDNKTKMMHKKTLIERLTQIIDSARYQDKGES